MPAVTEAERNRIRLTRPLYPTAVLSVALPTFRLRRGGKKYHKYKLDIQSV